MIKSLVKYLLTVLWVVLLLGLGYYLLVNNLCQLLTTTTNPPQWKWLLNGKELQVRTGPWVEKIPFALPDHFSLPQKGWNIPWNDGTIAVDFSPKFSIQWKKPLPRRKLGFRGE